MKQKILNFIKKNPKNIQILVLALALAVVSYLFICEKIRNNKLENVILSVFESEHSLNRTIEMNRFSAMIKRGFGI